MSTATPRSTTAGTQGPAGAGADPSRRSYRTTGGRVWNFNAGPSILPEEVIRQIQADVWDFQGSGFGILEHSHRAKWYDELLQRTLADVREAGRVPSNFKILFMTGGSSSQNFIVPMNLMGKGAAGAGGTADYIETDYWSVRSVEDARQAGFNTHLAWSGKATNFTHVPAEGEVRYSPKPVYVHSTSNNTIYGTQWHRDPVVPAGVPLVCDMCSDIFSRPIDYSKYAVIYASAQKNLGTTGATVVLVRDDIVEMGAKDIPRMLQYRTMVKEESRPNTPPHFAIYTVGLLARWIIKEGGVDAMAARNRAKAGVIYAAIDGSQGFYRGHARAESRSLMNITFRLASPELEERFITEAAGAGLEGTRGHRATGGVRVSVYNAFPAEGCRALAEFMGEFARRHG